MRQAGLVQSRARGSLLAASALALALALPGAAAVGACRACSAGDPPGGPIVGGPAGPAGETNPAAGEGKSIDEWLAYVAGETITRRMIIRQIGERAEGQTEAEQERSIRGALLERVMTGCMVWKAKQFGLELRPDVLDEQFARAAKEEEDLAKERGQPMKIDEILAQRGQSRDEFKELIARQILVQNYIMILMRGVPGKRPQLDAEPSPKDCHSLYDAHRDAFNVQAGIRIAMFSARPADFLDRAGDYDAAAAMAQAQLRAYASEAAASGDAERVATAHSLKKNIDWVATPAGRFTEKGVIAIASAEAWAFDPARRRGDVEVFDASRGALQSFAILEVRPARIRTYEEALSEVMSMIRGVRMKRFELQHKLEVLTVAPVKPSVLVDVLSDEIRSQLKKLDADPVTRDIRLR
jgi:hypothetical protein